MTNPNKAYYDGAYKLINIGHEMYGRAYQQGGRNYEEKMKYWENKIMEYHTLADKALRGDEEAILTILKELGC